MDLELFHGMGFFLIPRSEAHPFSCRVWVVDQWHVGSSIGVSLQLSSGHVSLLLSKAPAVNSTFIPKPLAINDLESKSAIRKKLPLLIGISLGGEGFRG